MNFEESRIYKSLVGEPFHKVAGKLLRWTAEGRDVTFTDNNQRTYLHVVADNADKFRDPRAVPVVYQLCLSGIHVDKVNQDGDTCLHILVRKEGVFRIVIALLRCGANPLIKDANGDTAEDILTKETPSGWQETLYWLRKYSPGLKNLLQESTIDTCRLKELLNCWCRLCVPQNGSTICLVEQYKQKEAIDNDIIDLLERHYATNELALAAISGSSKRIITAAKLEGADINTKDAGYRYHYIHSPEVAQPLLAAAWEQNSYDVIDTMMSLSCDATVLYTNQTHKQPKPLYFHALSGRPRPDSVSILHRILRSSDLTKRNHKGQTILFEAIYQRIPVAVFKIILTYDVDLAARDYKGRTARDFAEILTYAEYITAIDAYVIDIVKEMKIDVIEGWTARGYDHIVDVINDAKNEDEGLQEKLSGSRMFKDITNSLQGLPRIQRLCKLMFQCVDKGDLDTLHKYIEDVVITCQNKCGHSLLHRAIMSKDGAVVSDILSCYPYLIDIPDNLQRYPLHYVNLFFGRTHEVSRMFVYLGTKTEVTDIHGQSTTDYMKDTLTTHQHSTLVKEIEQLESNIYLREMGFEKGLLEAMQEGDQHKVEELLEHAGSHAKMAAYSQLLFDAIDNKQPGIATYLLQQGCDPDIWKQYEKCSPTADACVMSQCQHPVVSLQEHSQQQGYEELSEYIEELRKLKNGKGVPGSHTMNIMSQYGSLAYAT